MAQLTAIRELISPNSIDWIFPPFTALKNLSVRDCIDCYTKLQNQCTFDTLMKVRLVSVLTLGLRGEKITEKTLTLSFSKSPEPLGRAEREPIGKLQISIEGFSRFVFCICKMKDGSELPVKRNVSNGTPTEIEKKKIFDVVFLTDQAVQAVIPSRSQQQPLSADSVLRNTSESASQLEKVSSQLSDLSQDIASKRRDEASAPLSAGHDPMENTSPPRSLFVIPPGGKRQILKMPDPAAVRRPAAQESATQENREVPVVEPQKPAQPLSAGHDPMENSPSRSSLFVIPPGGKRQILKMPDPAAVRRPAAQESATQEKREVPAVEPQKPAQPQSAGHDPIENTSPPRSSLFVIPPGGKRQIVKVPDPAAVRRPVVQESATEEKREVPAVEPQKPAQSQSAGHDPIENTSPPRSLFVIPPGGKRQILKMPDPAAVRRPAAQESATQENREVPVVEPQKPAQPLSAGHDPMENSPSRSSLFVIPPGGKRQIVKMPDPAAVRRPVVQESATEEKREVPAVEPQKPAQPLSAGHDPMENTSPPRSLFVIPSSGKRHFVTGPDSAVRRPVVQENASEEKREVFSQKSPAQPLSAGHNPVGNQSPRSLFPTNTQRIAKSKSQSKVSQHVSKGDERSSRTLSKPSTQPLSVGHAPRSSMQKSKDVQSISAPPVATTPKTPKTPKTPLHKKPWAPVSAASTRRLQEREKSPAHRRTQSVPKLKGETVLSAQRRIEGEKRREAHKEKIRQELKERDRLLKARAKRAEILENYRTWGVKQMSRDRIQQLKETRRKQQPKKAQQIIK